MTEFHHTFTEQCLTLVRRHSREACKVIKYTLLHITNLYSARSSIKKQKNKNNNKNPVIFHVTTLIIKMTGKTAQRRHSTHNQIGQSPSSP